MRNNNAGVIALLRKQDEKISRIEKLLAFQKEILTFNEAALYTGLSKSFLYKITSRKEISYSKPGGKLIYFKKQTLIDWMKKNPISVQDEIDKEASSISSKLK